MCIRTATGDFATEVRYWVGEHKRGNPLGFRRQEFFIFSWIKDGIQKMGLKTADRFKGLIVLKVSSRLYFFTCVSYQVIVQNFEAKLRDTNVMFGETIHYLSHL